MIKIGKPVARFVEMSVHALDRIRERGDLVTNKLPDDVIIAEVDEACIAAFDADAALKILDEGEESFVVELTKYGAKLYALLRDNGARKKTVVTVLDAEMAHLNISSGKWTDRQGKPIDVKAQVPLKSKPFAALAGLVLAPAIAPEDSMARKMMDAPLPRIVAPPPGPVVKEEARLVFWEHEDGHTVEEMPKSAVPKRLLELLAAGRKPRVAAPVEFRFHVEVD